MEATNEDRASARLRAALIGYRDGYEAGRVETGVSVLLALHDPASALAAHDHGVRHDVIDQLNAAGFKDAAAFLEAQT